MSDWNTPVIDSLYADFLAFLKARDVDAATLCVTDPTNQPVGTIRYLRSANKFQEWNGTSWVDKVLAVAGGGTGSTTPGGAQSALGLGTMALQNSNNIAVTGGNVNGLNSLSANGALSVAGNVNFQSALDVNTRLTVQGTINTGGRVDIGGAAYIAGALDISGPLNASNSLTAPTATINGPGGLSVTNDIAVGRTLYAPNVSVSGSIGTGALNASGNINASNVYANVDISASRNIGAVGQVYAGSGGQPITNPDGSIVVSRIAPGYYTGAGTRVLTDNGIWSDSNLIGGGVREIVHQNMSFGTDEYDKDIVIPWAGAQPAAANRWYLQFDQPYQDQASSNGGPVFYSVTYLGPNTARIHRTMGPGAVAPILAAAVVYTAFHLRTEV